MNTETPPQLQSIRPLFVIRDLKASRDYYLHTLGFQLDFEGPQDDPFYCGVSRDGIGLLLKVIAPEVQPTPNPTRHEWARWDAFIHTTDPDALFAELRERSARVTKELCFLDPGLWGFEVDDVDGYRLAFAVVRD